MKIYTNDVLIHQYSKEDAASFYRVTEDGNLTPTRGFMPDTDDPKTHDTQSYCVGMAAIVTYCVDHYGLGVKKRVAFNGFTLVLENL